MSCRGEGDVASGELYMVESLMQLCLSFDPSARPSTVTDALVDTLQYLAARRGEAAPTPSVLLREVMYDALTDMTTEAAATASK